ncbi:MAG: cyclase family protein [Bacteroidales bacterium]|nr:cyclase family protein [Bacteroidales bacterium]MBR0123698.1 cyclase family protein [Bacteroidales bacterium]
MKIIDLSFVIENGIPTCGTPWHQTVKLEQMGTIDTVGRNTHSILLGSHTGTHMDAPYHFVKGGRTIESTPLETLCGPISVIDFSRFKAGDVVQYDDVKDLKVTERMLFRFDWFKHWRTGDYYKAFPFFSEEAVSFLMANGIKLLAMDTPSPDDTKNINSIDSPNHKALLSKDIIIIEYLNNTDQIDLTKKHTLVALPLKLKGSDGSPSRVILFEE